MFKEEENNTLPRGMDQMTLEETIEFLNFRIEALENRVEELENII